MNQRASIAVLLHQLDRQSPAGFAIALHIRFTTATYLFQTYPKRWMDHYSKSGFVVHDPTVRWGLNNVGRVRWTALESIDEQGVLDRAKDFGLMHGVAVAVVTDGSRSIASFARADRDYDDAEMAELERLLAELHRATTGPGKLSESDQAALTELSIRLSH
jgi:LuxR family transcriptional regulator, quorum-sensing system regulator SdiA